MRILFGSFKRKISSFLHLPNLIARNAQNTKEVIKIGRSFLLKKQFKNKLFFICKELTNIFLQ
jgi:hypothetical protein